MNTELQSNKYIVKRNFISKDEAKKLAEEFEDNIKPIFLPEQIEKMRALQRHENPDIKEYIRK